MLLYKLRFLLLLVANSSNDTRYRDTRISFLFLFDKTVCLLDYHLRPRWASKVFSQDTQSRLPGVPPLCRLSEEVALCNAVSLQCQHEQTVPLAVGNSIVIFFWDVKCAEVGEQVS